MDLDHIIPREYDPRVQPPTSGHKPLEIHTKLTIYGVLEVNTKKREILVEIGLMLDWKDTRLGINADEDMVELDALNLHLVWTPSPYFMHNKVRLLLPDIQGENPSFLNVRDNSEAQ